MNKVIITLISLLVLSGCQQVENRKKQKQTDVSSQKTGFEVADAMKEVYHRFPTPEEMLSIISVDSINYNPYILNSPKEIHQYLDSRTQALNLGVYVADLAYLTIYEKHNESIKYFEAIYELSDKLRISSAFERSLLKRIQENINNSDSLKVMSEQAFISLSSYLESNDNEKVFALMSMGGFIEALYLSFHLAGNYNSENPIIQQIADQKYVLENIIKYALPYANDKAITTTISELNDIREVYSKLSKEETETKVTRDADGKIILKGGNKLLITELQFIELKELSRAIRKEITQN